MSSSSSDNRDKGGKKRKWQHKKDHQPQKVKRVSFDGGLAGFIITCHQGRERKAVGESFNILNECADKLYPAIDNGNDLKKTDDANDDDMEAAIAREVAEVTEVGGENNTRRFYSMNTGIKGVLFIRAAESSVPISPNDMAREIFEEILRTKEPKSRLLSRLVPIQTTCTAVMDRLCSTADEVIKKYFGAALKRRNAADDGDLPKESFKIMLTVRHNTALSKLKDQIISSLADTVASVKLVQEAADGEEAGGDNFSVNLGNPDHTIFVFVAQNTAAIGVCPRWKEFRQYNLAMLNEPITSGAPVAKVPALASAPAPGSSSPVSATADSSVGGDEASST
eukprot:TRINITY_DN606_c0_g1_i1.p1 TRINITY_DN606_c0_g1~~TRINITY_DN606_c0_g1_i1.p1  ORF type:complete len:338 (+),score=86.67 TRINITY_DN606_c0_g1_i1:267-1280(+)